VTCVCPATSSAMTRSWSTGAL